MASTYTTNLGIEKPGTGEQSGTWGTTANTNYDLIDQAINGIVQVTLAAAGTSGSPNTIDITNGTASDGRNKYIEFVDGGDLGATAYVQLDPNDAEKIVHMRNSLSGSRSVIVFQGTYNASNDFEIPAGKDVVLKFDGGGASATVTQVFVDLKLDALDAATVAATTGNITTVNATTVDTTNLEVTNLKAKDGTSAGSIADSTGVVTIASAVLTTADINGGTMDGVTIGGASTAAGSFTTVTASGRVTFGELKGTGATVVNNILDEDNMSSNSDTALATQQSIKAYVDSQVGTVDTLAEILANGNTSGANNLIITAGQRLTTDSILETSADNGVNIDSVVLKDGDVNGTIGQVTAKAANFTTMGASSNVTVGGTLGVTGATTLSSSLSVNTGAVFNEGGGDNDFRVESDTNEYALFVDAGSSHVNIGTATDLSGVLNVDGNLSLSGNAGGSRYVALLNETDAYTGTLFLQAGGGSAGYGGAVSMYGHSHATYPGMVYIASSSGSGGKVVIGNSGIAYADGSQQITAYGDESEVVINEASKNMDFRVESNTDTHALFVDAGTSKTMFNTSYTADGGVVTIRGTYGAYNASDYRGNNALALTGADPGSAAAGSGINLAFVPITNRGATAVISGESTSTNKEGGAQLRFSVGGSSFPTTQKDMLMLNYSDGAIFNEGSADLDFRVESDSSTYALLVDAGGDFVAIGNNTKTPASNYADQHGFAVDALTGATQISSDGVPLEIGRTTTAATDGSYLVFRSGSSVKAKIAVESADNIMISAMSGGGSGLLFWGAGGTTPVISPAKEGVVVDGEVGLGRTAERFSRLYLSDGVNDNGQDGSETAFNDGSTTADFRVESNNYTHMLFVDAGADHVNVGTNLDLGGILNVNGRVAFRNPSAQGVYGIVPTGWGYSPGAYGVLQLGQSGDNGGTVSIGYDPIGNSNASFTGNGSEMLFANGIDLVTPDSGDTLFYYQITMGDNGVIVNENSSSALDFRVESDNNSSMFFIDASTDAVQINKAQSGASALTVSNSSSNGSNVGALATSLSSTSNNTNCWHLKSTTQTISSYYLYGDGSSSFTSDERLKTDIVDVEAGQLDKLNAVRFVNFKWKNSPDSPKQMGVIAQEIEKIFPDFVSEDENAVGTGETYKSVSYSKLNMIALKAIQELSAKVETLEARIAALEAT